MDARYRVWSSTIWDPLLYLGLLLFLLLLCSAWNSGCKLVYQLDTGYWEMGKPPVHWLPFSVHAAPAYLSAAVALAIFVGAVIIRHGLTRTPKRKMLQALAVASGVVALIRCIPYFNIDKVHELFLQTMASDSCGVLFGFWSICTLGLFDDPDAENVSPFWKYSLFVFGVFANLLGMLFFSSHLSAGLGILLFLIVFLLRFFITRGSGSAISTLKTAILSILIIGVSFALLKYVYPNNPISHKVAALDKWEEVSKGWTEQLPVRSAAAMDMFQNHMWCGVGVDGYREFIGLTIKKDTDWKPFRPDQGVVRNDYVQLLAEYGLFGSGIVLSILIILLAPIFYRSHLYFALISNSKTRGDYPFPPEVVAGLAAAIFAGLAAGIGNPFRSPAVAISFVFVLSALPVFLPKKQNLTE